MVLERRGVARGVDEHPAVPLLGPHRHQGVLGEVEAGGLVVAGSELERAVEGVGPGVVRAVDGVAPDRRVLGLELVAPVAADVVEGPQPTVVAAHQHHAVVTDPQGPAVAGVGQVGRAPRAHPAVGEEVLALPGQDGLGGVGLGGQHPAGGIRGRGSPRGRRSRPARPSGRPSGQCSSSAEQPVALRVLQDPAGAEQSGDAGDPAAAVGGRRALVEPPDRRGEVGVARRRAHVEELVGGELAVEDVPADQAVLVLHLVGPDDLAVDDGLLEVGGQVVVAVDHPVGVGLQLGVVRLGRPLLGHPLGEQAT